METIKLKVGDILSSKWGYNCTIVDYFSVVGVTEKTVKLQELKGIKSYSDDGLRIVVNPTSELVGKVFSKKIHYYDNKPLVVIESYQRAYLWDGKAGAETLD